MTNKLPNKLRDIRIHAGLSQNQLAKMADISTAFVSKLEAGHYDTISLDICKRLANAFDMTMCSLLEALGLIESESHENVNQMIKNALRKDGYSDTAIKDVLQYATFIKTKAQS